MTGRLARSGLAEADGAIATLPPGRDEGTTPQKRKDEEELPLSHIVTIETAVRDAEAVRAACRRLKLPAPAAGTTQLYSGAASGLAVELPDWRYPVVCDLTTGRLTYDDYGGRWGERAQLDRFLQAYAVEKAKIEARRHGHAVSEQPLSDGSIRLTVHTTGGAA